MTFNPYEAPQSAFVGAAGESDDRFGPWRDGADLVTLKNAKLPPRCVKCNSAAQTPLKTKTYYWHSAGWYLLILFNLLIYIIAAMIMRKSSDLSVGLCAEHRQRRTRMIAISVFCLFAGVGLFVYALVDEAGAPLFALSGLFLLTAMIVSLVGGRIVHAKRISERYARFGGCSAEFLDSLPRFHGSDR
jgi:hypothetical protein